MFLLIDNSAENATSRRENDPIRQVSEWVESQSCYTCSDGPSESGYGTRSEISEKTSATETKEGGTDLASEGDCAQSDTSPSGEFYMISRNKFRLLPLDPSQGRSLVLHRVGPWSFTGWVLGPSQGGGHIT